MIPAQYKEYISNVMCCTCKVKGHLVRDCLHAKRQSNTLKANAAERSVSEEQLVSAHRVIAAHALLHRRTVQEHTHSGAACHMCNVNAMFKNTYPLPYPEVRVRYADGHAVPALWEDTIHIPTYNGDIKLDTVLCDHGLLAKLLSVSALIFVGCLLQVQPRRSDHVTCLSLVTTLLSSHICM